MLTLDYIYEHHGTNGAAARCRVRIYQNWVEPPVLLLSELSDNPGQSVSNAIEAFAGTLIAKHFPERVGVPDGVTLIEHYSSAMRMVAGRPVWKRRDTFDRVRFLSWQPQERGTAGRSWTELKGPARTVIPEHAVMLLCGEENVR